MTEPPSPPQFGARRPSRSPQPLQEVIADADRIGNRGERRVYRPDADEETRVHHVQIVELVRLAVHIQDRALRIRAEAARPDLMGTAGDRDITLHIDVARDQVTLIHAQLAQHRLHFSYSFCRGTWLFGV